MNKNKNKGNKMEAKEIVSQLRSNLPDGKEIIRIASEYQEIEPELEIGNQNKV